MDEAEATDQQHDERKLGRLRAGIILRAHMQGWPAIDLGGVTVSSGPESWAAFLEGAAGDEVAAALAALDDTVGRLP